MDLTEDCPPLRGRNSQHRGPLRRGRHVHQGLRNCFAASSICVVVRGMGSDGGGEGDCEVPVTVMAVVSGRKRRMRATSPASRNHKKNDDH